MVYVYTLGAQKLDIDGLDNKGSLSKVTDS